MNSVFIVQMHIAGKNSKVFTDNINKVFLSHNKDYHMSKITKITTIRCKERANIIWVEITTDEGIVGLGEAFRGSEAVEAVIHHHLAPYLIGKDSRQIEMLSRVMLTPYVGFHSASAEVRAASAIDIALWDLCGKRHGIPVYEALGGASRSKIATYNTCSGYSFNSNSSAYNSGSSRRAVTQQDNMAGPYDDQIAFMQDAGKLAESLLAEGYRAMKIWPFDIYAGKNDGQLISLEDLQEGLLPFKKIRDAVGNKIEIMCELHSLWNLPSAIRICQALEEYHVLWAEDPINKMDDAKALQFLRTKTKTPICGSETLAGATTFRTMLEQSTLDYVMVDLSWCGGLTEARKIATLSESYATPVAPHDCTGPVVLWASAQLALHATTAVFQEVVRANLATWYNDFVTALPVIEGGFILAPHSPGIGTELRPEVRVRDDVTIREYV
ncbi:mandelate racemase/muconate lactonizing enzyme family protein [Klebsiella pneumoniae]|uniref:mandelate racemase/muconate lactonizing enzyme family protein n=1 Tax=Klebsiella pneumoniae TaxID=573 RepID=UPI002731E596|nr:mandelate racemase/muconate lactonizing enzyme family protein [Klebsiella pneumoniae]MDP0613419.1 mandelate racemase/muconate lactonizing enzyme family protein [Klebsiella pneumoniae]